MASLSFIGDEGVLGGGEEGEGLKGMAEPECRQKRKYCNDWWGRVLQLRGCQVRGEGGRG